MEKNQRRVVKLFIVRELAIPGAVVLVLFFIFATRGF